MEKEELREHLTTRATWIRGLYMLLFAVIYSLAEVVVVAVVLFQFIARLVTGEVNERLLEFGQQLSRYLYDILRFCTFNNEEKPYPFAPWNPTDEAAPAASAAEAAPAAAPKATAKKKAVAKKRAVAKRRTPAKTQEEPAASPTAQGNKASEEDDTPPT